MHIRIPFGRDYQQTELPDERLLALLAAPSSLAAEPAEALLERALRAPIASPPLRELSAKAKHVLLLCSDHTRPVPSRLLIPAMLDEIRAGNPEAEIVLLIASGLHREITGAELREKFGEKIAEKEHIEVHNSYDRTAMTDRGVLPSGSRLLINRWADWADLIVAEGFIEPHFFAGFSGGRKSVLPGIASTETVCGNHCAAFIADSHARTGILKDNPIHRDMVDAVHKAGLRFIVNAVLDSQKKVEAIFAGDALRAHEAGCAFVSEHLRVKGVPAGIVITSNGGYPLDQNLYQAVKGMTAAEACVQEGGVIILCAQCADGLGGEGFYRYFAGKRPPRQVWDEIMRVPQGETRPDQWQAQILARVMQRAQVILVSAPEMREPIENMGLGFAPDLTSALEEATRRMGSCPVTVIPDGVGIIIG